MRILHVPALDIREGDHIYFGVGAEPEFKKTGHTVVAAREIDTHDLTVWLQFDDEFGSGFYGLTHQFTLVLDE